MSLSTRLCTTLSNRSTATSYDGAVVQYNKKQIMCCPPQAQQQQQQQQALLRNALLQQALLQQALLQQALLRNALLQQAALERRLLELTRKAKWLLRNIRPGKNSTLLMFLISQLKKCLRAMLFCLLAIMQISCLMPSVAFADDGSVSVAKLAVSMSIAGIVTAVPVMVGVWWLIGPKSTIADWKTLHSQLIKDLNAVVEHAKHCATATNTASAADIGHANADYVAKLGSTLSKVISKAKSSGDDIVQQLKQHSELTPGGTSSQQQHGGLTSAGPLSDKGRALLKQILTAATDSVAKVSEAQPDTVPEKVANTYRVVLQDLKEDISSKQTFDIDQAAKNFSNQEIHQMTETFQQGLVSNTAAGHSVMEPLYLSLSCLPELVVCLLTIVMYALLFRLCFPLQLFGLRFFVLEPYVFAYCYKYKRIASNTVFFKNINKK